MKKRTILVISICILLSCFIILLFPGNSVIAYYGLSSGISSPNGGLYGGLGSLYGGYGLYGGMYGGYGLYGSGLYGMYGGLYGGLGGGLYGGYGLYGGMYGGYGLYGSGLYGMYGGYGGIANADFGLANMLNPLSYYSYGGMYNLMNTFDPLGDPLLGLGMFSFAFL